MCIVLSVNSVLRRGQEAAQRWLAGSKAGRLTKLPHLELATKEALLPALAARQPAGIALLGVDAFGTDLRLAA